MLYCLPVPVKSSWSRHMFPDAIENLPLLYSNVRCVAMGLHCTSYHACDLLPPNQFIFMSRESGKQHVSLSEANLCMAL